MNWIISKANATSDPNLLDQNPLYHNFGPIGLTPTLSKEHTTLRTDGERVALFKELPQLKNTLIVSSVSG